MAKFDCRMIEVCPTSQEPMRAFTDSLMAREAHSVRPAPARRISDLKFSVVITPYVAPYGCSSR